MKTTWEILRVPIRLFVVSGIGLFTALVSDGLGDTVGWICLAYPVWVAMSRARPR
jgi:hypothetical protein